MAQPRYACGACGTWTCAACGWKRPEASANYREHACALCPSREGTLMPTMHTARQWQRHNGYDTPLPVPYAYREHPPVEPGGPWGRRTATTGPEFYRGIRVPRDGPYARIDIASWKKGVDDCLRYKK